MSPFVQHTFATMIDRLIKNNHLPFDDHQSTRFYMYNERVIRFFHSQTLDLVRQALGKPVKPSYVYFGGYVPGAGLTPHTDRPACEYTLSLLVDQSPAGTTWSLGIKRESLEIGPNNVGGSASWPAAKDTVWAEQQPGDGFLILGRKKIHFRDGKLPEGMYTRAYFLHYVNEDFTGEIV